jgi:hypothetical protein
MEAPDLVANEEPSQRSEHQLTGDIGPASVADSESASFHDGPASSARPAPAARIRNDLASGEEHGVEHPLREPAREGVLLTDELRTQDLPLRALERRSPEVREP